MRQAQARKLTDAYLGAPRRSEHLHVVADALVDSSAPRFVDLEPRVVDEPRVEVPAVDIPDWAEPFADARWDDRLCSRDYEERDGRRTVLVTGRPEGRALPRRDVSPRTTARRRRHTPTRARLAGRPDRVALWAVALALLMAAMAGFTGNGHGHSSHGPAEPSPAQLLSR
jgi:hypothetical protein